MICKNKSHLPSCEILEVSGETLVQPKVLPPGERHQVSEPLMGELVGDHRQDSLLFRVCGEILGVEQVDFPRNATNWIVLRCISHFCHNLRTNTDF